MSTEYTGVPLKNPTYTITHAELFAMIDDLHYLRMRHGFSAITDFMEGAPAAIIYMVGYQQAADTIKRELNETIDLFEDENE